MRPARWAQSVGSPAIDYARDVFVNISGELRRRSRFHHAASGAALFLAFCLTFYVTVLCFCGLQSWKLHIDCKGRIVSS
jgi:hypothetical protein